MSSTQCFLCQTNAAHPDLLGLCETCAYQQINDPYEQGIAEEIGNKPSELSDIPEAPKVRNTEMSTPATDKTDSVKERIGSFACDLQTHISLKEHQLRVVRHLTKQGNKGLIVYHKAGSGKTLPAVALAQCMTENMPHLNSILIITPASLTSNFLKELAKYNGMVDVDRANAAEIRDYLLQRVPHVLDKCVIMTKEKLTLHCKAFWNHQKEPDKYPKQTPFLFTPAALSRCALIVDEAHHFKEIPAPALYQDPSLIRFSTQELRRQNFKNIVGVHSLVVQLIARHAQRVCLLSGTVLPNSPRDLVPLLNMVSEETITAEQWKKLEKNTPELKAFLTCKISFYEPDVDDYRRFFPRQDTIQNIRIVMSREDEQRYWAVAKNQAYEVKDVHSMFKQGKNLAAFLNGARRAVNVGAGDGTQAAKMRKVFELIQSYPGEKFLVFSHFKRAGIELLESLLTKANPTIHYNFITGDTEQSARQDIVRDYNDPAHPLRVLLLTSAGGEGLHFTETDHIILMEPGWNKADEEQVIARGVRFQSHALNADAVVHVYRMIVLTQEEDERFDALMNSSVKPSLKMSGDVLMLKIMQRKIAPVDRMVRLIKEVCIEKTASCS